MARVRVLMLLSAVLIATVLVATLGVASDYTASLKPGKAELKSAGALAFGPDGILFVGDSAGAAIWALDTGDRKESKAIPFEIQGINEKIAAMLGTTPDQLIINDAAVNPLSKSVYISVSRGKGPAAIPVILKVDSSGQIEEFSLVNVKHSRADLPNAPTAERQRQESITDLAYVEERVIVAGLSSEEFSSNLRSIPFPFQQVDKGTSVEIFHGSHGRFETNSPVRTFTTYRIKKELNLLAAYTCTPLVRIPFSSLAPGAKVTGTTIAELGNRNRPLDMIVYHQGGKDFILMNNSSRGVMKMSTENIDGFVPITKQTEITGLPYETITTLTGVEQLDRFDDANAVILARSTSGSLDLKSIPLP